MIKMFKSSLAIGLAASTILLATLSACSDQELTKVEPQDARKRLTETGYSIDQEGFRQAVDGLDAAAAQMFIAAGFNVDAMADAITYPVKGTSRYHQPKLPLFLEDFYRDDSFREILVAMFDNGFSPTEPILGFAGGGMFPYYTTNLMAEALRLGDEEFIGFLREYGGDFNVSPGCFQHRPDCSVHGSLAGWIFHVPQRNLQNGIWSLDDAIAAYGLMKANGLLAATPASDGASDHDPFLMASIAYQKFFWAPNDAQIDALWQEVGKPRPILPYGMRWKMTDPAERNNIAGSKDFRDYLVEKAFPCLEVNDYVACVEAPPA